MPIEAPKIDKRTFDDIVDETAKWAEEFTDWQRPADDKPDAGLALIRIFAGMASQVIDRLNQVPEKNFLAFLDLIGTQIQPPQPARVPLTFLPAAGTGEDSFMQVPANTQAAAPPAEGEEEEVIFETQRDLVLTTARLTSVFVRQPDADGYADYTALATGVVYDAFPAFEGDQPIEHSLYLAHDEFFTLAAPKTITLTFDSPDAARLAKLPITWSYWDGVTWQPLSRSSGIDTGLTVTFEDPPIAKVKRGKAIDGQGRKIELTEDQTVDLGTYFGSTVLVVISYSEEPSKPPVVQAFPESDVALYPVETYLRLARLVVDSEGGISESVKSKTNGAKWTVTIENLPVSAPRQINGQEAAWLRARLDKSLPQSESPLPQVKKITAQAEVKRSDLAPDLAFANSLPLDLSKDFYPFGEQPRFNDTFYLASAEVFGKPGAQVTVDLALSDPPPMPPKPSCDLEIAWEAWDGQAWKAVKTSSPPVTKLAAAASKDSETLTVKSIRGFAVGDNIRIDPGGAKQEDNRITALPDSTFTLEKPLSSAHEEDTCVLNCSSASFLCSGQVTFTLPSELGQRTINGQTAYWIRARIAKGNFGTPEKPVWNAQEIKMTGGFGPPSVASLSLSYAYEADGPLTACKTCNDFTFEDHTQTAAVANDTTFRPFQPCADTQPSLYLGFDRRFANRSMTLYARVDPLQPGQVADRGVAEPARVIWEYAGPDERWHHLGARDETNAFTESGLIQFSGPTDLTARAEFGRELYWLRARQERGKFPVPPRLRRLLTNTTWASQATTIPDEILGSSSGEPNQVFRTTRWPVLLDPRIEVREPGPVSGAAPGIESEQGEQASGRPADTGGGWRQVPNFYASGPGDRHYVLDHLSGKVHFGDGRHGAIPPPGRILAARYRTGGGRRGTRSAGQITQLKSAVPYVAGVTNHQAAAGGVEQQDLEHVREYGPRAIRHRGYAVTRQDVEDLAYEASTEVARAKTITPRVPPSHQPLDLWLDPRADSPDTSLHEKVTEAGVMRLIVVPRVEGPQPIPSLGLLEQVKAYLKARCPATTDLLRVDEPDWVEVTVKAEVVPTSSAMANVLPARLKAALERFLHPLTGGPLGNGWPFGRLPYLSDLYALVESVESVDHVRTLTIDSARQITERSLIFSGRHEIKMAPVTE